MRRRRPGGLPLPPRGAVVVADRLPGALRGTGHVREERNHIGGGVTARR